jgi:hypothetical protein
MEYFGFIFIAAIILFGLGFIYFSKDKEQS